MPETGTLIRRWRDRLRQAVPRLKPSWPQELARSLRNGRLSPAFDRHLDELLVWLSNPDHPHAAELTQAIRRQGLDPTHARTIVFRLLDQRLFDGADRPPAQVLGLEPGVELGVAKQRYRRLIQVYHPDRHPDRTDWATRCTEQINRAFTALQRGDTGTKRGQRPPERRAADQENYRPQPPSWVPIWLGDGVWTFWRWVQGRFSARSLFERRLRLALATVGLVALVGLLWPQERPKPKPRIIHHPIGVEAPRIISPPPMAIPPPEGHPPAPMTSPADRVSAPPPEPASQRAAPAPALADKKQGPDQDSPSESPPAASADRAPPAVPLTPAPSAPAPLFAPQALEPPQPLHGSIPPDHPGGWQLPSPTIPLPEPPRAPLAPVAPLPEIDIASAPPAVGTSDETRCWGAAGLLERFKNAYQDGALDRLMALYSPLAKENDLASWFAIRQAYDAWFQLTTLRRIDFGQIQVQPLPNSQGCAIHARYQVGYRDQQARIVTQTGDLELLLEAKGPDWLILRARY